MAPHDQLRRILQKLNRARIDKQKVRINCEKGIIKSLLTILRDEQLVKLNETTKTEVNVEISSDVSNIQELRDIIPAKNYQLREWVIKLVPTITGHLILSTSEGLMTHHKALNKNLGGKIIGLVY